MGRAWLPTIATFSINSTRWCSQMGSVTISGNDYDIYGSLAAANTYMAARLGADAWSAATDTTKKQALVTASRLIQSYLIGRNYNVEPETSTSLSLAEADYELAFALIVDPGIQDQIQGAQQVKKRVKAGTAEVEYFASAGSATKRGAMPSIVQSLLDKWIKTQGGGSSGIGIPYASGTCERSTLIANESQIRAVSDCGCATDALPYSSGGSSLVIDDTDPEGGGGEEEAFTFDSETSSFDSETLTWDAA
jgi:hypothetical protein